MLAFHMAVNVAQPAREIQTAPFKARAAQPSDPGVFD